MKPREVMRGLVMRMLEAAALCTVAAGVPLRLFLRAVRSRPRLSVWTGTPIINLGRNSKAERLIGCRALSVVAYTYAIAPHFDVDLGQWRRLPLVGYLVPYALFVYVCLFADRVHVYFDRGTLPTVRRFRINELELFVYGLLGVRIFAWTYGADVRTRNGTQALGSPNVCQRCPQPGAYCICDDRSARANLAVVRRHATAMFAMGDMQEYTPGSRNDLFFWPVDIGASDGSRYAPEFPRIDACAPLRVVHASNHRNFKGTDLLEQAVAELAAEGCRIELAVVENTPNDRALEIYRGAHVIFDQCINGFHGYFALEGMALGKPVMSFIRKPGAYLLDAEDCPIIRTHPATLKRDLRALVSAPERLHDLGMRSRRYVERHFSLEAFAARLRRAYIDLGVAP